MGGRGPGRFAGRWARGRLRWRKRLWAEWKSVRRVKSRVVGYVSVSEPRVHSRLTRAGGWSWTRAGPRAFCCLHVSRVFICLNFPLNGEHLGEKNLILTLNSQHKSESRADKYLT